MATGRGAGRTALITGASSGIGLELLPLFAADGFELVLVARSRTRLLEIASDLKRRFGREVHVVDVDLSREGCVDLLVGRLDELGLRVDVLVNNAGYGLHGPFAQNDPDDLAAMIELNVSTPTALTRRLLPKMLERGEGRIMNVASTAAFQPGPLMAAYYASKAYVLNFSEALDEELRGTGVRVTCLCPGFTATRFQDRAGFLPSRLATTAQMPASRVARAGYAALMRGERVFIPGALNAVGALCVRFLPRRLVTRIVRTLQDFRRASST